MKSVNRYKQENHAQIQMASKYTKIIKQELPPRQFG